MADTLSGSINPVRCIFLLEPTRQRTVSAANKNSANTGIYTWWMWKPPRRAVSGLPPPQCPLPLLLLVRCNLAGILVNKPDGCLTIHPPPHQTGSQLSCDFVCVVIFDILWEFRPTNACTPFWNTLPAGIDGCAALPADAIPPGSQLEPVAIGADDIHVHRRPDVVLHHRRVLYLPPGPFGMTPCLLLHPRRILGGAG